MKMKKGNKNREGFFGCSNQKFDSNGFFFKNYSKHRQVESCFGHLVT
jgi:hypothetical protein